jgi:hypothetical protein
MTLQARFDRSQPSPVSRRGNQARGEVKVGDSSGATLRQQREHLRLAASGKLGGARLVAKSELERLVGGALRIARTRLRHASSENSMFNGWPAARRNRMSCPPASGWSSAIYPPSAMLLILHWYAVTPFRPVVSQRLELRRAPEHLGARQQKAVTRFF